MKTTIVLALLLAATPAFAQSSGGPGAPGATTNDYKLSPHAAATKRHPVTGKKLHPVTGKKLPTGAKPSGGQPAAGQAAGGGTPGAAGGAAAKQPMGRP
jgi:hypothetical protein